LWGTVGGFNLPSRRGNRAGDGLSLVADDSAILPATALAVDSDGGVHIAYPGLDGALHYASRELGGSWELAVVDPDMMAGPNEADEMTIAATGGTVRIAYSASGGGADELRYATRAATGNWTVEVIDQGRVWSVDMATEKVAGEHLAYVLVRDGEYYPTGLQFAFRGEGEDWAREEMIFSVQAGQSRRYPGSASISVDASGAVHVLSALNINVDARPRELNPGYAVRTPDGIWSSTLLAQTLPDHIQIWTDEEDTTRALWHDGLSDAVVMGEFDASGEWNYGTEWGPRFGESPVFALTGGDNELVGAGHYDGQNFLYSERVSPGLCD
jgi:hypothetical protein